MEATTDRLALLRSLRPAGAPLLTAVTAVLLVTSLVPAATALSVAFLVSRVSAEGAGDGLSAAWLPLAAMTAVLIAGHAADAALEPLTYLARSRIDGAHRAEVARLAASGDAIGALESPEAQRLVREAKADPENWTQRTPADGALAQLRIAIATIGLVASCAVLAGYAWWLVPLLVIPALLLRVLRWRRGLRWYQRWQEGMDEGLHADRWQPAIVSAAEGKDARIFGFGDWAVRRIQRHVRAMFEPVWALGGRQVAAQWSELVVVTAVLAAAYSAVALGAVRGQTSVAVATAVFTAAWSIFLAFGGTDPRDLVGATACLRAFARLRDILGDGTPTARQIEGDVPEAAAEIRFEDVSFTYPGTTRTVLKGLDLTIRPGELLAVVGLNGAGKSTLIKLLAGLYRPTSGRITVDGRELTELGLRAWRERISVVFQDFVRYHLPIADNVALGRASAPRDQAALEVAAKDAGLDIVLADLPKGWETPLSRDRTDGVDLSGGQWQQVVLARTLYAARAGATLLVLDEPTAHLDVRTEFDVFERLTTAKKDATVVLISHRLSTVRRADRIVLLQDGRITESGDHEALMALGGEYARMFEIQAERFRRGYDDRIEEDELW
jgi:ABC-type multidrug transport system fused ATPase/permease subunit